MKTISICGSMKLTEKMVAIGKELESRRYKVFLPNVGEPSDYSILTEAQGIEHKSRMIYEHLVKIKQSDAVLVVNETLKNINGYIGANTFLEMGFAYALGKKIYTLNPLPDQPNKIEIAGLLPIMLNGSLENIDE